MDHDKLRTSKLLLSNNQQKAPQSFVVVNLLQAILLLSNKTSEILIFSVNCSIFSQIYLEKHLLDI